MIHFVCFLLRSIGFFFLVTAFDMCCFPKLH